MKRILRAFGRWLWRQIMQPDFHRDELPQDGPVELWTSRPTQFGERPERKICGVGTKTRADEIAEQMGLLCYHVLGAADGRPAAQFQAEIDADLERAERVA